MALKRVERTTARVRREYERILGKRGFAELLDRLAGGDNASLPQASPGKLRLNELTSRCP